MSDSAPQADPAQPQIEFFRSWCKKCGICAAFCPTHVIEQDHDGSPVAVNPQDCIECLMCETRCPDFAIKVKRTRTKEVDIEPQKED